MWHDIVWYNLLPVGLATIYVCLLFVVFAGEYKNGCWTNEYGQLNADRTNLRWCLGASENGAISRNGHFHRVIGNMFCRIGTGFTGTLFLTRRCEINGWFATIYGLQLSIIPNCWFRWQFWPCLEVVGNILEVWHRNCRGYVWNPGYGMYDRIIFSTFWSVWK